MKEPAHTITVIIPAYNAGKWLGRCLESVKRQTFPDFRVVVADDGSTDDTAALAASAAEADSRFALLRLPHGGVSAARNAGLSHARGEWVFFIDADDAVHPRALELALAAARSAQAQVVIPRMHYGEVPREGSMSAVEAKRPRVLTSRQTLRRLLLRRGIEASMCGTLYRRELFEGEEPLRFGPHRYEDLDLGYRVLERAQRVALLPATLYFYRRHEGSFIRSLTPDRFDVLDVTDRMYRHFRGTELEDAAADRRFGAHCNILMVMYTHGAADPDVEARCMSVVRAQRRFSLLGRGIRLRNRLGALASYGGTAAFRLLSRLFPCP